LEEARGKERGKEEEEEAKTGKGQEEEGVVLAVVMKRDVDTVEAV